MWTLASLSLSFVVRINFVDNFILSLVIVSLVIVIFRCLEKFFVILLIFFVYGDVSEMLCNNPLEIVENHGMDHFVVPNYEGYGINEVESEVWPNESVVNIGGPSSESIPNQTDQREAIEKEDCQEHVPVAHDFIISLRCILAIKAVEGYV